MPWGLSPAAGSCAGAKAAGESSGAGIEEAEGWAGWEGASETPPLLFLHRRALNPSPASIIRINL